MKNLTTNAFFILLLATTVSSCAQKTNGKSVTNNYTTVTNPSTSSGTNSGSSSNDPYNLSDCNGVYRSGATRCYFTEIPQLKFSGTSLVNAPTNVQIWSSTSLPSTFSQNNFMTDGSFQVRIKPSYATVGTSQQGLTCSGPMAYNFTRVRVYFMLRRQGDSIASIYSVTANVNSYSSKLYLPVISGTTQPYILEIMGIESDHRCNSAYGSLSTNEKAACTAGTYWGGIPLNSGGPTSCVALNVEFATDETYGLP